MSKITKKRQIIVPEFDEYQSSIDVYQAMHAKGFTVEPLTTITEATDGPLDWAASEICHIACEEGEYYSVLDDGIGMGPDGWVRYHTLYRPPARRRGDISKWGIGSKIWTSFASERISLTSYDDPQDGIVYRLSIWRANSKRTPLPPRKVDDCRCREAIIELLKQEGVPQYVYKKWLSMIDSRLGTGTMVVYKVADHVVQNYDRKMSKLKKAAFDAVQRKYGYYVSRNEVNISLEFIKKDQQRQLSSVKPLDILAPTGICKEYRGGTPKEIRLGSNAKALFWISTEPRKRGKDDSWPCSYQDIPVYRGDVFVTGVPYCRWLKGKKGISEEAGSGSESDRSTYIRAAIFFDDIDDESFGIGETKDRVFLSYQMKSKLADEWSDLFQISVRKRQNRVVKSTTKSLSAKHLAFNTSDSLVMDAQGRIRFGSDSPYYRNIVARHAKAASEIATKLVDSLNVVVEKNPSYDGPLRQLVADLSVELGQSCWKQR